MCLFRKKIKTTEYKIEKFKNTFYTIINDEPNDFGFGLMCLVNIALSNNVAYYYNLKDTLNCTLKKLVMITTYIDNFKINHRDIYDLALSDIRFSLEIGRITESKYILNCVLYQPYLKTINITNIRNDISLYISSYDEKAKKKGGR
jgi:hypothetical protein